MGISVKELLAAHAAELVPQEGDRAYTRYHSREWIGILTDVRYYGDGKLSSAKLVPEDPKEHWGFHNFPGLFVGYKEDCRWDAERAMFFVSADPD